MGSVINNTKDGNTIQKMLCDNAATACVFLVLVYKKIMAKNEIKGIDAIIPPTNELRLAISETTTIKMAEMITLMK